MTTIPSPFVLRRRHDAIRRQNQLRSACPLTGCRAFDGACTCFESDALRGWVFLRSRDDRRHLPPGERAHRAHLHALGMLRRKLLHDLFGIPMFDPIPVDLHRPDTRTPAEKRAAARREACENPYHWMPGRACTCLEHTA